MQVGSQFKQKFTMVQAVSCQAAIRATRVQSAKSSFEIYGGEIGKGTGLSTRNFGFPRSLLFHQISTFLL